MAAGEDEYATKGDDNTEIQAAPTLSPAQTQISGGTSVWLPLGFFAFGFALSWTTALTQSEGSGMALLTGFFSFVGGAFVSFAGFRFERRSDASSRVDPAAFGLALFGLSTGLVVGGPAAYLLRTSIPATIRQVATDLAPSEDRPGPTVNVVAAVAPEPPHVYKAADDPDTVLRALRLYVAQRSLMDSLARSSFEREGGPPADPSSELLVLLQTDPQFLLGTLENETFTRWLEQPEVRSKLAEALSRSKGELARLAPKADDR